MLDKKSKIGNSELKNEKKKLKDNSGVYAVVFAGFGHSFFAEGI